jgi:hypothetical protein
MNTPVRLWTLFNIGFSSDTLYVIKEIYVTDLVFDVIYVYWGTCLSNFRAAKKIERYVKR